MKVRWKKLLFQSLVWLAAEILLNFLGTDDLADYTEFLFEGDKIVIVQQPTYNHHYPVVLDHGLFSGGWSSSI